MLNKILLFGGTFDPIHLGHVKLCQEAIRTIKPDLTIVMPNKIPTLRDWTITNATAHDRLEMCKIAFRNFKNLEVSDFEIRQISDEPSHTYKTIKYLVNKYKDAKIYLLIGYDRLLDLEQWERYDYIISHATIVAGIREKNQVMPKNFNGITIHYKPIEVSATQLRNKLNPNLVDQKVIQYIKKHYLYLDSQIQPLMSDHRFQHTLRVKDTAIAIALGNNYEFVNKVIIASMYHDICKEYSEQDLLKICQEYDKKYYPSIHTLHGLAASIIMKDKYGIKDKEVLNAVKNHVIPQPSINTLGKILYLADKLEPARTKQDIDHRLKYFNLACKDIDQAFEIVYKKTMEKY